MQIIMNLNVHILYLFSDCVYTFPRLLRADVWEDLKKISLGSLSAGQQQTIPCL